MKKILEIKERRLELVRDARQILNKADAEKRDLTKQEAVAWNKYMADVDALGVEVVARERQLRIEAGLATSDGRVTKLADHMDAGSVITDQGDEIRLLGPGDSFRSAFPQNISENAGEEPLSLRKTIRGLVTKEWAGAEKEKRALSSGGDAGFLLAPELSSTFIDLARSKSTVLLAGARIVPMSTGELLLARLAGEVTSAWRPESVTVSDSTPTFDQIRLKPKTLSALVFLPIELAADAPNVSEIVENAIVAKLGLELDRVLLYGNGADEPKGLDNYRTAGGDQVIQTTDPAAALTDFDDISLAQQRVKEKNFQATACIMSPRSWGALDRAKEGITNSVQPIIPPASWSELKKFVTTQVLDTQASTESSIFVGQFDQLLVGLRNNVVLEATRTGGDAFKDMQLFIRGYLRVDAALAREGGFAIVTGIEA